MLTAEDVLEQIAASPYVMGVLGGGPCAIQHVARRVADGPDERLDACPCARKPDDQGAELGGGQYIASATHTLADLVRDVLDAQEARP